MFKLSDEFYNRNEYLKTDTVPTQSEIRRRLSPALANVYLKSLKPKMKVIAGLEPPMKGGGSDWYVPPDELLKGKTVMKPLNKKYLTMLGCKGILQIGETVLAEHKRDIQKFKVKKLTEIDNYWKNIIHVKCDEYRKVCERTCVQENTKIIESAFHEFCILYSKSLTNLEDILFNAAVAGIQRVKADTVQCLESRFETMVKQAATKLYDEYNERLLKKKKNLRSKFAKDLEEAQTIFAREIHDINIQKHKAVEKLKHLLECQNLACQVYVALKEREEGANEIEEMKRKHKKEVKHLSDEIALKDFEIKLAKDRLGKHQEIQTKWQEKICRVVKKFQLFISYCLNELPEHAEFFINTEKLLLLQVSQVLENPVVGSMFESDEEDSIHTPAPRPHPFFLFCDKGYKPDLEQNLCPEHCTSSASQLPVIVVNKRCIYAACDNFEMFSNKVAEYIRGKRGDDEDFVDHHDYTLDVPIKCTSSELIQDVKMESSLLQLLQNEYINIKNLELECGNCRIPYCFCSCLKATPMVRNPAPSAVSLSLSLSSGNKITSRLMELEHEREPKWDSYMEYVESKKCKCSKMAKKHLKELLPPYMRQTSEYEAPVLPNYEMCDLETLKRLVREAKGKHTPSPTPQPSESKMRDVETQYSDLNYDYICTCFCDEMDKFMTQGIQFKDSKMFDDSATKPHCKVMSGSISPSYLSRTKPTFATEREYSLKNLLDNTPELQEIFRRKNCNYR